MAFNDLQEFIAALEERDELVRIPRKIGSGHEIFTITWELNQRQGPGFIAQVEGYEMPVAANLMGTLDRWALAAGFPGGKTEAEYRDMFAEKLNSSYWADPVEVKAAPCQEAVAVGEDVDLDKLPVLQWHPLDGGRYITAPIVITNDDRFGYNLGTYRVMVHAKNLCTIMTPQVQDIGIHVGRALAQGKDRIPCCIAIGCDPAVVISSMSKIPLRGDEYAFAAALRGGEPVKVVKSKTNGLLVPATAEIVLEGELMLKEPREEGPFCEWMGFAEEPMVCPTFRVRCVTSKSNPIYHMTVVGHERAEETRMRMVPQMASFLRDCRERVTGFKRAHLPLAGRQYIAVISIDKRGPGWGKHAAVQAVGIPFIATSANMVIVVDDDIDPANLEEVFWALGTRVDPERDVILLPPAGKYPLNPAGRRRDKIFSQTGFTDYTIGSTMAIDATLKKFGENEGHFRPAAIPVKPDSAMWDKVKRNWTNYGFAE